MNALEEATTATAALAAPEDVKGTDSDVVQPLVVDAEVADEQKHEVTPAAEETAADAPAVPEPEPAEAPAATATAVQQEDAAAVVDAAAEPAAPAEVPAADEPVAAEAELLDTVPATEDATVAKIAADEAPAALAEPGAAETHAESAAAEEELAGDGSAAGAAAAEASADVAGTQDSTPASEEQKHQYDAAAAVPDSAAGVEASEGTAASAAASSSTAAGVAAEKDAMPAAAGSKVVAPAAGDEAAAAANADDEATANGDEAAAVNVSPPAGTVAAAKALFLRSQTSGDSATGAPTLAPLSMRSSRVSSTSAGGPRISGNGVLLGAGASLDDADEATHIKVRELREQLSATHPNLTGGSLPASAPASPGREDREKGPLPLLSEHDKVNTTNVAELLRTAEFKLVPGIDRVPYEELIKLRLEDGVDVTRKEEYLSDDDFKTHLGVDREAYTKLPQWKKLQLKKGKMLF